MEGKRFIGITAVLFLVLAISACTTASEPEAEATGVEILVDTTYGVAPPTRENPPATETAVSPPTEEAIMLDLPDLGPAPEIVNQTWLNTDEPITIASQRGKVILIEFWTFG